MNFSCSTRVEKLFQYFQIDFIKINIDQLQILHVTLLITP